MSEQKPLCRACGRTLSRYEAEEGPVCDHCWNEAHRKPAPQGALPPIGDMDAAKWAASFVAHVQWKPSIATDEGTMIGWFANAIMAGYDTAAARKEEENARLRTALENIATATLAGETDEGMWLRDIAHTALLRSRE